MKLDATDIRTKFKQISKFNANRVLKRQINMTHIETGLQCTLLFESNNAIAISSEILKLYIDKEPMCKNTFS